MSVEKTLTATESKAQYDTNAKSLLAHKIVLANILTRTLSEFKGMNPYDVVPFIEGEPFVSSVPVNSGETNITMEVPFGEKIVGLNTEHSEANEGTIFYDVIFYVRMKNGLTKFIVNVEMQKDEPVAYNILNRAIFYISRLISSQKDREFVKSDYDNIKSVCSIWVCMNMKQDTLNHIHFVSDAVLGNYEWKGNLDLVNIFMIGVAEKLAEKKEENELQHFLGVLFSNCLTTNEKMDILHEEYYIKSNDENELRGRLNIMCNLSEGIVDDERKEIATKLIAKGSMSNEEIADCTNLSVKVIEKIKEEMLVAL